MRLLPSKFLDLFRRQTSRPAQRRAARHLEFEALEQRCLLANASGVLTGAAFIDANFDGVHQAAETTIPGIKVNLTGTTTQGTPIAVSVITNDNGVYTFDNVLPGTYAVNGEPGSIVSNINEASASGITIVGNDTQTRDLGFGGLTPRPISLRLFLASSTAADLPFDPAGSGTGLANYRSNTRPTIRTAIANVSVAQNAPSTLIDLAANFSDPDTTNSNVLLNTSEGPVNITTFDEKAPQTVANFFNYVTSGRFGNTVFHRNAVQAAGTEFVLQGGGFKFQDNPSQLVPVVTDPTIQNEFGTSNTLGTVAMAKLGNDPNSASSQFFFNLGNNSGNLDNQNGGFTVFGQLAGATDQTVVNKLAALPVNVVQTITFGGSPTGGTFTLTFKGVTGTVTWDANKDTLLANIQTALNNMSSVGTGNSVVTALGANSTDGFRVTFQNALNTAIPVMTTTQSLTGTNPSVTISPRAASPFDEIPLTNYTGSNFPTDTVFANYGAISSATITKRDEGLTFSIISNTNSGLVTASIVNERLTLAYTPNTTGSATITVRASDRYGATLDTSFTVTVT